MSRQVILDIQGRQTYPEQEPEIISLTTEGEMEPWEGGWRICYRESDLTGLEGVVTTFHVTPEQIVLTRTGGLHSQMVFRLGVPHESLYQMPFGALMLTTCATSLFYDISEGGGVIRLSYTIDIEQSAAGVIDYALTIRPAEE